MQVVRRADGNIVDSFATFCTVKFIDVAIKALKFGEEIGIRKEAVDNADRVVLILVSSNKCSTARF